MLSALVAACDISSFFPKGSDETFGDQNFKSAIALIELHKTRNGNYPEELSELEFLGQWDPIWIQAVKYEKVEDGYNLFVLRGAIGEPDLEYPAEFWNGLGLIKTNVKKVSKSEERT